MDTDFLNQTVRPYELAASSRHDDRASALEAREAHRFPIDLKIAQNQERDRAAMHQQNLHHKQLQNQVGMSLLNGQVGGSVGGEIDPMNRPLTPYKELESDMLTVVSNLSPYFGDEVNNALMQIYNEYALANDAHQRYFVAGRFMDTLYNLAKENPGSPYEKAVDLLLKNKHFEQGQSQDKAAANWAGFGGQLNALGGGL